MPQMAPIWWSTMYTIFILLFAMMCIMIYNLKTYSPKKLSEKKFMIKEMNWKW